MEDVSGENNYCNFLDDEIFAIPLAKSRRAKVAKVASRREIFLHLSDLTQRSLISFGCCRFRISVVAPRTALSAAIVRQLFLHLSSTSSH